MDRMAFEVEKAKAPSRNKLNENRWYYLVGEIPCRTGTAISFSSSIKPQETIALKP